MNSDQHAKLWMRSHCGPAHKLLANPRACALGIFPCVLGLDPTFTLYVCAHRYVTVSNRYVILTPYSAYVTPQCVTLCTLCSRCDVPESRTVTASNRDSGIVMAESRCEGKFPCRLPLTRHSQLRYSLAAACRLPLILPVYNAILLLIASHGIPPLRWTWARLCYRAARETTASIWPNRIPAAQRRWYIYTCVYVYIVYTRMGIS